jgi:hypothetical protein
MIRAHGFAFLFLLCLFLLTAVDTLIARLNPCITGPGAFTGSGEEEVVGFHELHLSDWIPSPSF